MQTAGIRWAVGQPDFPMKCLKLILLQVQIGYKVGGYSNRPDIVIITTKFKSKSIYFDTKHIGYSDTRL